MIRPKDTNAFYDAWDEICNWATQKEVDKFITDFVADNLDIDKLDTMVREIKERAARKGSKQV